jgi:hypothetical protein
MSDFVNTLQSVANFVATHVDLMPLAGVGGYTNEPFLSIANDALSEVLLSQVDWKWNRADMPSMVTAINKQDYTVAGAIAFTLGSSSTGAHIGLSTTPSISVSAGVVTVTTLEPHRFNAGDTVYLSGVIMGTGTASKYNSVFTDNGSSSVWSGGWVIASVPTSTTFTFAATSGQNNSDAGGAPGITDFGWLASASMAQLNDTGSPVDSRPLQARRDLGVWSKTANPEKVAVIKDNGDGTLKVRFQYVPSSTIWLVNLVYQKKPVLKTALTGAGVGDWSPIPDHYSALYRQAVLYRAYRYLGSPKETTEYQKFQAELLKAQGGDDREQTDVHVVPAESLMDNGWYQ